MKEVVLAGFGGQGVLTVGLILAEIAVSKGRLVTWLPSYGSAMRGGTANCTVKYGEEPIENPALDEPDVLMALNTASFNMFSGQVAEGGLALIDSEMVDQSSAADSPLKVVGLPCVALSESIGHKRGANIVMTGALVKLMGDYSAEDALAAMNGLFAKKGKNSYAELNSRAFRLGYDSV